MTHGAHQQQELDSFFGGLTSAMYAEREQKRDREKELLWGLQDLFGRLSSVVDAEEKGCRIRHEELQRELDRFFGRVTPEVQGHEERQRRVAVDLIRDLARMFGLLEPTIEAAIVAIRVVEQRQRAEEDRRTGRRFSVFDLVRTKELDLSRVFHGLLDPLGSHSQGDLFLSLLLEELSSAPGKAAEVIRGFRSVGSKSRVHREYSISTVSSGTSRGYIDLVVELEHNRWIGIENKPWAQDQEEQVPRYLYALLDAACRKQPDRVVKQHVLVLYLSGDGSDPDLDIRSKRNREHKLTPKAKERMQSLNEDGEYWRNWITVPYLQRFVTPSVEGWVRRCYVECEADRVRRFLHDLLDHIRNEPRFKPKGIS